MLDTKFVTLIHHKIYLFFFLKFGIRSKDRIIQEDQSHHPLAEASF